MHKTNEDSGRPFSAVLVLLLGLTLLIGQNCARLVLYRSGEPFLQNFFK